MVTACNCNPGNTCKCISPEMLKLESIRTELLLFRNNTASDILKNKATELKNILDGIIIIQGQLEQTESNKDNV